MKNPLKNPQQNQLKNPIGRPKGYPIKLPSYAKAANRPLAGWLWLDIPWDVPSKISRKQLALQGKKSPEKSHATSHGMSHGIFHETSHEKSPEKSHVWTGLYLPTTLLLRCTVHNLFPTWHWLMLTKLLKKILLFCVSSCLQINP